MPPTLSYSLFFFFNDTATTEIYTLSLHDALPIYAVLNWVIHHRLERTVAVSQGHSNSPRSGRSEEHTSELQSPDHLVCRLLLEKKKKTNKNKGINIIKRLRRR